MAPTIGLLVVSEQKLNCTFTPSGPNPPEHYTGTMGTVGIDVGVIGGGLLAWAVYMPTQGPPQGSLAGTYGGASGSIAAGVGVCAIVLFGRFRAVGNAAADLSRGFGRRRGDLGRSSPHASMGAMSGRPRFTNEKQRWKRVPAL